MINALAAAALAVVFVLCAAWLTVHIKNEGIQFGTAVIAACVLFYQFIPLVFYLFPAYRDLRNVYNAALAALENDALIDAMLQASALVGLMIGIYSTQVRRYRLTLHFGVRVSAREAADGAAVPMRQARMIAITADVFLLLGIVAIGLCIKGAGGVWQYLSLGALTRGIGKDVTQSISREYLPMITLSAVILIPPFLYCCAMRSGHRLTGLRVRFALSCGLSLLYLVYNQGRVPLVMFLLPFLLSTGFMRKMKVTSLAVLFVISCLLLEHLSSLFNYLSYGRWYDSFDNSIISALLREFTYPFANFALRRQLVEKMGLRWGCDLVTWPVAVLPSAVLRLFDVDKSALVTIGETLTETYTALTDLKRQGGIPSDLFFFFHAQCGVVSLLAGMWALTRFLAYCDKRFSALRGDRAAEILVLRAAMVGVSCVNHFDVATLVRTRFDLLVMLAVLFHLAGRRKDKRRWKG